MINWKQVVTFLDMRRYPEDQDVRDYMEMICVLISRNAYDRGVIFDVTEGDIKYGEVSDEDLKYNCDKLFKKIFIRYGSNQRTA